MTRLATLVSSILFLGSAVQGLAAAIEINPSQPNAETALSLPAGTKVELVVTAPIWAKTAKPGDPLRTQTYFPVTIGNRIAIPAGAYVEGEIQSIRRPTRKLNRGELDVLFKKIILSNGYVLVLERPADAALTGAAVTVQASVANDLLLDNGAQLEMTLAAPLEVDAARVAAAIRLSQPPSPGSFKSATQCRPVAGSPGSSGSPATVIPGTPGTPSTTIPGGPGMPDITIPGTPATPDTVIPGTPGTAGTPDSVCPAAPMVISSVPMAIKPIEKQPLPAVTAH